MNTGLHEFGAPDNDQGADMAYGGPVTGGRVGRDSLLQIIWRGRLLIVVSVVIALAAAYGYLRIATPMYVSVSRILVEKPSVQSRYDAPQPAGTTSSNYLQTQASMITGRDIIAATLRDPNVLSLPTFRGVDQPVEEVLRTLSASVGRNVDIISVRAESAFPEDAAQMVNAVVGAYVRWHEANRQLGAADLLRDLNAQLTRRYQELRTKRKEKMAFEKRFPEVVESAGGGVISTTLDLLRQDLASARVTALEMNTYYEGLQRFENEPEKLRQYVLSRRGTATTPGEVDERSLLEENLIRTQLQLQELTDNETDSVRFSHQKVLEKRVQNYQERIAKLDEEFVQKQVSMAKTLAEDAQARVKQLTEMYEAEFAKVQGLSGQDSEYTFILSECDMLQDLCDSLLNQVNALDLSTHLEGLNIHVLERALPATKPSSPKWMTTMVMGLVLGLMAGVGLAFVRDWRDQRVRSADEIATLLGVRVLGAVPSISSCPIEACGQRLRLAPGARESEAYRAIRTALCFGAPRDQAVVMLVTSPGHGEGKTTLVSNLGIAMAEAGQRTLILDADLRGPMQDQIFSMNGSKLGLADALTGMATLEQVIRHTEVRGLDVVPGGSSVSSPSELLASRGFARMLEQLKGRYDRILVDSPPIGIVTDAQILATLCGLTLLVLRAEHSTRIPTQRARDALLTVRARLVGVVVNDVAKGNNRYSHYEVYGPPYHGAVDSNGDEPTGAEAPADSGPSPEGTAFRRQRAQTLVCNLRTLLRARSRENRKRGATEQSTIPKSKQRNGVTERIRKGKQ